MDALILKKFYDSLESNLDRKIFKKRFYKETKLSYPTFYNYTLGITTEVPHLCAEKIKEIAKELYPEEAVVFFQENTKGVTKTNSDNS